MSVFLKIKLKSLAAEARIIRAQELKTRGTRHNDIRESLHLHRVGPVRRAARETHLAYGYLRGRTYAQVEREGSSSVDWKSVANMVKKYGTAEQAAGLEQWRPAMK